MTAGFASPLKAAIMLHQVEDFSGVHDWSGGDPNPNPPVILADSGPLGGGDPALRVTSNGGSGPGGKLLIFNNSSWTGNHSTADVTRITLALRNTGNTTLSFRLAFNGPGGWFAVVSLSLLGVSLAAPFAAVWQLGPDDSALESFPKRPSARTTRPARLPSGMTTTSSPATIRRR